MENTYINKSFLYDKLIDTLFLFKNTHPQKFDNLISGSKLQNILPTHLFKNNDPKWNGWHNLVDKYTTGIGYFVIYPPDSTTQNFIENITFFRNWWMKHFEKIYPDAKRDAII